MTTIPQALADLKTAVESTGLTVSIADPTDLDPPTVLVGPPRLEFSGMGRGPTNARFLIAVVVPADDQALDRLWALTPQVADAIDQQTDGVAIDATPSAVQSGGTSLPAYEITVEVPL